MKFLDPIGWRVTGLRNRLMDRFWERRLGIQTRGSVEVNRPDSNRYATFAYGSIHRIVRHLDLRPTDAFVDIGCGKGRVICSAARFDVRRVIGVDIDPALCEQARTNASTMRGRRAIVEVSNCGAQDFDYGECTKFFLFNSFGAATLKLVLESIERSLREDPRPIRFAYVNPFHDAMLAAIDRFEQYDHWSRTPWSGLKFDVSFWRNNAGAG